MRQLLFASLLLSTACNCAPPPTVTCYKEGQIVIHGDFELETHWSDPATVLVAHPGQHTIALRVDECTLKYNPEKIQAEANP